jgi:hypothetical protein
MLASSGSALGVDISKAEFFCPWVFGPDAKTPEEMTYLNTTDPNEVSLIAVEKWETATNAGRLYFLLFSKFRDRDLFKVLVEKSEAVKGDTLVETRSGSVVVMIPFSTAKKKVERIEYDWAGVPVNW